MQQVSILDVNLKLVSIKRAALRSHMFEVVRCLAFKNELAAQRRADPFFNLTLNAVELSIFADAELVDKAFLTDRVPAGNAHRHEAVEIDDELDIEVSEDIWIALQVEGHDEEGETSGIRLRDISAPLAATGISILFLSTYISDFLLIKRHRLELVISILEREQFMSVDGDEVASSKYPHSQSPFSSTLENKLPSTTAPGSSSGNGSLPSQLPRSLTRSASSHISEGYSSSSRSPALSPVRTSSQQSYQDSRTSSLSRSRPSFGASSEQGSEVFSPSALSPPFELPAFDNHERDLPDAQPRSFDKMQESILSDTSAASGIVDKISLLPDEIVCVGLNMQHELVWRTKLVHALFYIEDVLPPGDRTTSTTGYAEVQSDLPTSGEWDSRATSRQSHLFSTTPTPKRPTLSFESHHTPSRTLSASTQDSRSQALFTATSEADYPIPFLSMTLTEEGGSLITDIRLLRALFAESDESVVFAPGGGLTELWSGEQDEDDGSSIGGEESTDALSAIVDLNLERRRSKANSTAELGTWDVFDEAADWQTSADSSNVQAQEDEDEEGKLLFASGRRLFKCLQLDLSSFGLEKAGLAHQFATLITKEKINLLYSATFRTANILVAKRHIRKARNALESSAR